MHWSGNEASGAVGNPSLGSRGDRGSHLSACVPLSSSQAELKKILMYFQIYREVVRIVQRIIIFSSSRFSVNIYLFIYLYVHHHPSSLYICFFPELFTSKMQICYFLTPTSLAYVFYFKKGQHFP